MIIREDETYAMIMTRDEAEMILTLLGDIGGTIRPNSDCFKQLFEALGYDWDNPSEEQKYIIDYTYKSLIKLAENPRYT